MREITITGKVRVCRLSELSEEMRELLRLAQKARANAQAPYSRYLVGAAVRSRKTGKTYSGCNVERCSYTQTTHAEQSAVDMLVAAEGAGAAIAAVAVSGGPESGAGSGKQGAGSETALGATCCGHCLQIIWENCHGDREVPIMTMLTEDDVQVAPIGVCLPLAFGPDALGVKYED